MRERRRREVKALRRSSRERRGRARARRSPRCRTCPTRRARRGGRGRCARSASAGARPARDHLELAGDADRHGGAARASRARASPTCKGDLVLLELALVRCALELLRGHGFEPVVPPVLVREEALYGTGFLPDTEQQIYALPDDDLYLVGTSEVAARLAARRRDPRRRRAAAALRGLLDLLPPRGRRRGQGHARDLPRAPVRQGRDVRVRRARGRRGDEHERLLAIEEEILQALEIPYRVVEHRGRRPRRLGGQEVRLRGLDARPGALPRADLVLEHDRLPGAAPGHPLPAAERRRARPVRTRSTAPRSPSGAR